MKNILFGALALGLVGCGISEDKLEAQTCDWIAACEWDDTVEAPDCPAEAAEDTDGEAPVCTFNKDAAKACSEALDAEACTGYAENFPSECADVYDCE